MNVIYHIKIYSLYMGVITRASAFIFVLLFFNSCIDEISLGIPKAIENKITIYGKVVRADPSYVSVFVARIGEINEDQLNTPDPIVGAQVKLLSDDGNSILIDAIEPPGNYFLEIPEGNPDFQVEIGKTTKSL